MSDPLIKLILACSQCGDEIKHIYCENCAALLLRKQDPDDYTPLSRRIEKLARRVVELERKVEEKKNERTT